MVPLFYGDFCPYRLDWYLFSWEIHPYFCSSCPLIKNLWPALESLVVSWYLTMSSLRWRWEKNMEKYDKNLSLPPIYSLFSLFLSRSRWKKKKPFILKVKYHQEVSIRNVITQLFIQWNWSFWYLKMPAYDGHHATHLQVRRLHASWKPIVMLINIHLPLLLKLQLA